jgi:hypothetical protein
MADLDCKEAFRLEMDELKKLVYSLSDEKSLLLKKLSETNELLKILCKGLLGVDKE